MTSVIHGEHGYGREFDRDALGRGPTTGTGTHQVQNPLYQVVVIGGSWARAHTDTEVVTRWRHYPLVPSHFGEVSIARFAPASRVDILYHSKSVKMFYRLSVKGDFAGKARFLPIR